MQVASKGGAGRAVEFSVTFGCYPAVHSAGSLPTLVLSLLLHFPLQVTVPSCQNIHWHGEFPHTRCVLALPATRGSTVGTAPSQPAHVGLQAAQWAAGRAAHSHRVKHCLLAGALALHRGVCSLTNNSSAGLHFSTLHNAVGYAEFSTLALFCM